MTQHEGLRASVPRQRVEKFLTALDLARYERLYWRQHVSADGEYLKFLSWHVTPRGIEGEAVFEKLNPIDWSKHLTAASHVARDAEPCGPSPACRDQSG